MEGKIEVKYFYKEGKRTLHVRLPEMLKAKALSGVDEVDSDELHESTIWKDSDGHGIKAYRLQNVNPAFQTHLNNRGMGMRSFGEQFDTSNMSILRAVAAYKEDGLDWDVGALNTSMTDNDMYAWCEKLMTAVKDFIKNADRGRIFKMTLDIKEI